MTSETNERRANRFATPTVIRYTVSLSLLAFSCWVFWFSLSEEGRALAQTLCATTLLSVVCPR